MSLLKEIKEYWNVSDYREEEDKESRWEFHEELPDSSSYKSENARRNIQYYESIHMFNEAELWQKELLRLETDYPLIHNRAGGTDE